MFRSIFTRLSRSVLSCPQRRMASVGMFCFQCEQTRGGQGCRVPKGVCGKKPEVAALQDLIIELGKRMAAYATLGRSVGYTNKEADRWLLDTYFATLTNVNFDQERFAKFLKDGAEVLRATKAGYFAACQKANTVPAAVPNGDWDYKTNIQTLINEGRYYGIDKFKGDWDVISTKELALYGIKGATAYLHHAMLLGYEDEKLYASMERLIAKTREDMSLNEALGLALEVGAWNYQVMELLDKANTGRYGMPEITSLRVTPIKGKCILVSGHDLHDLDLVLKQTEGKGINVYTHGEMLPCNAYPGLKKYKHLIGNYGGPWQRQREDFDKFPGSILMTTNCIITPKESYASRLFTRSSVGFPGVTHLDSDDMSKVVEAAMSQPGFAKDEPKKEILAGFGRAAVLNIADVIVNAVKDGAIKHFFLVGGCDGYELDRSYYTDFAKLVPKDCVILTLACGKYRFNMLDLGTIDYKGTKIPRVLDIGQCNDAYSAIQIALALSSVFKVPINDLPLSFVLSWFEQKAVAILLTLLHLGVKNMVLGPNLPAFITPKVLQILASGYGIRPITTPADDIKRLMSKK